MWERPSFSELDNDQSVCYSITNDHCNGQSNYWIHFHELKMILDEISKSEIMLEVSLNYDFRKFSTTECNSVFDAIEDAFY